MEVINKIKIDLLKPGIKPMANVMQADENTRVIEVSLYANGIAWEVPTGVSFSMAYKKPDGTRGIYDTMPDGSSASSVVENVVSIKLAPQMLTAPGTVNASVVISSGDQRLSTFPIIVNVIQNPAAGAVGSEDYFYSSVIGNLDDLKTTDKSSVVAAINEIFSTGGGSDSGQNPDLTGVVKSVNGVTPDENGNVEITVSGSGGAGLSSTEKALMLKLFYNATYSDPEMQETYNRLRNLWNDANDTGGGEGGSGSTEAEITQTGSVLYIVSGVSATKSGTQLTVA